MVEINDKERFLNLNYTVVYFLLKEEEMELYASKVRRLNCNSSLTQGFFHFEPVLRGETVYDSLTPDIKDALNRNNIIVRLANKIHNIYCYGLDYIDLELGDTAFIDNVNYFMLSVCKSNWINLDSIQYRPSLSSRVERRFYKQCGFIGELFRQIVYDRCYDPQLKVDFSQKMDSMRISDPEGSMRIIQTAVGSSEYDYIAIARQNHHVRWRIVKVRVYKKNKAKNPSFDFIIGDEVIAIKFATYAQSLTYAATLYAVMTGGHFSPQPFNKICEKQKIREDFKQWLEPIYYALGYNPIERSFEECFEAMCGGVTKKSQLSQIKSKITTTLQTEFYKKNYIREFEQCSLDSIEEDDNYMYYHINIKPENIIWELPDPYPHINE